MKRALDTSYALVCNNSANQSFTSCKKTTLDQLLLTIRTTDFSCDALHILATEIHLQYSIKANRLVQYFPSEMWSQVLSKNTSTLAELLGYRTVCKAWSSIIPLSSKVVIPEDTPSLYLTSRRTIPTIPQNSSFFAAPGLMTRLKTLIIHNDYFGQFEGAEFSLPHLRKLVLLSCETSDKYYNEIEHENDDPRDLICNMTSFPKDIVPKFTQLEVLSTQEPVNVKFLETLTNLKKLTAFLFFREERADENAQYLTQLTNLKSLHLLDNPWHLYTAPRLSHFKWAADTIDFVSCDSGFFNLESCTGTFVRRGQGRSNGKYQGKWHEGTFEGKGSVWVPRYIDEKLVYDNNPHFKEYRCLPYKNEFPEKSVLYGVNVVFEKELKEKNWFCYWDGVYHCCQKQGPGVYHFQDGCHWHGTWDKGKSVGQGTFETGDGTQVVGLWEDFKKRYVDQDDIKEENFWNLSR